MTHIDRRAMTNGKAARRLPDGVEPPPMTWAQWMHPKARHLPVTRGELLAYGDQLGKAIEIQRRANRWHRRVGRWLRAWGRYLVAPQRAAQPAPVEASATAGEAQS